MKIVIFVCVCACVFFLPDFFCVLHSIVVLSTATMTAIVICRDKKMRKPGKNPVKKRTTSIVILRNRTTKEYPLKRDNKKMTASARLTAVEPICGGANKT